ncbi:MAG TPA: hypothetical protein VMT30_03640 [Candidatus Saccharimonadia bacterium]|nr:hypothetical protein [Candidatus Saccharimonadia bacterium]
MSPKPSAPNPSARRLLDALSIVANVSAVVGVFQNKSHIIIIIAASLALATGAYLLIGRWGKPLGRQAAFVILMMLAGSSTLAVSIDRLVLGTPSQPIFGPPASPTPSVAPSSSPSPTPKPLFSGAITLTSGDAIDLEAGGRITPNQSLATGSNDLFLNDTNGLAANADHADFYSATNTSESEAYARCVYLITNDKYRSLGAYYVSANDQYCFKTSDGHIAWFRSVQSETHKKVLSIRVWDK